MASQGTKRKQSKEESPLMTTEMNIMMEAKQITENLVKKIIIHQDIISKINEMNNVSRKKATIGIFGKSGEGKSSLLSAVLGKQDLLPSGCFGACTAVVTQVEANLDDSNYTAEIELLSKEEWEKELTDLFRDIHDKSEERNEELIDSAVEKITALYGPDAEKKTVEQLMQDDIVDKILSTNKRFSKSDVSEFTNEVACYIQHSEASPGGWYWPLVKSVTIMIPDCRELLENIVLVDLPGTGDCNKMRNDLWRSKLSECSSVWIVSDIKRAITDKDPWGILKHCIEELGPGGKCKSINFICTKTDDISEPEAYMRSARLSKDPNSGHQDKKRTCTLHRNEHAKTKVKEKFDNSEIKKILKTDNQFEVITVSSSAFFDHSLNLESSETEIPKLQDDLRILNKSIRRELTRDYVNEAKGTLLLIQSGHLDTDKKMIEMKVKVCKEFERNLMKSLNDLEKYFESITNDLQECLSDGVHQSLKQCVASTKAVVEYKRNGRACYKIVSALCRNYGCYWSRNLDVVLDLNKTLATPLHECIAEDFNTIFPVSGKTGKSVQEQIEKFSIVQSDSGPFRSVILHHIHDFIEIEENQLKADLNRDIVDMKKEIYSSIQTTIRNEMASCYESAAAVKGTGSMKLKQKLLINTVAEIKHEMFKKAKMILPKKLNNLKLYIMDSLEKGLKKAIELSQSQTSENTWMDVSREIEQLERLLQQLSD